MIVKLENLCVAIVIMLQKQRTLICMQHIFNWSTDEACPQCGSVARMWSAYSAALRVRFNLELFLSSDSRVELMCVVTGLI